MGSLVHYTGSNEVLATYFRPQLKRGGFPIVFTGGTGLKIGTGKSFTALRFGELIDPKFSIKDVCFTLRELLDRLDEIEKEGVEGRVIILDEAEIIASNRAWQSVWNQTISEVVATFRNLNCMLILVTPMLSWIDTRLQGLLAYWGYSVRQVGRNDEIVVKLHLNRIRTDLWGKKIYFNKLRFYDERLNCVVKANDFKVGLPNEALIEAYELKSKEFKTNLRKMSRERVDKHEYKQRALDPSAYIDRLLLKDEVQSALREKGKVTLSLVRNVLLDEGIAVGTRLADEIRLEIMRVSKNAAVATAAGA